VWSIVLAAGLVGTALAQKNDAKEKPKGGGQIIMNIVEIKGRVDQPQAVYIINLAKPDFKGIKLEKDFTQDVRDEDFRGMETFKVDQGLAPEVFETKGEP
jgi:hypothetical protein